MFVLMKKVYVIMDRDVAQPVAVSLTRRGASETTGIPYSTLSRYFKKSDRYIGIKWSIFLTERIK